MFELLAAWVLGLTLSGLVDFFDEVSPGEVSPGEVSPGGNDELEGTGQWSEFRGPYGAHAVGHHRRWSGLILRTLSGKYRFRG
jgi:hypothetical protein